MMLSSFNNKEGKILDVQIEDYAGVAFRGFIEGFYGGWDYASRASLMRFARDVKDEQLCLRIKDRCISYIKME